MGYRASVKIAVVIPTLDEATQIGDAIRSASVPGVEIIVVDGGSADGTAQRAAAAGARVVTSSPGRARQLGVGARECCGDVILFLHADTRLPRGWDAAVRRALEDAATVGGAFRMRFDRRTPVLRLLEWGVRLRVALLGMPYGDQALFVRRGVLEAMGGVPQVAIMEDLDLVSAMKRRGRLARLPLAVVTSSRRHRSGGPLRTALRHVIAALAWRAGLDRAQIADWVRR